MGKAPRELLAEFEKAAELEKLADQILEAGAPELEDARGFRVCYLFTNKKLPKHATGYCRRIPPWARFLFGKDYLIMFNRDQFFALDGDRKGVDMVHELRHVMDVAKADKPPKPGIRDHSPEFCTFDAHDKISPEIWARIRSQVPYAGQMSVVKDGVAALEEYLVQRG